VAALGFALAFTLSCSSDGGGNSNFGDYSAIDGTWDSSDGEKIVLNNGSFTLSQDNDEVAKGTYSASGSNITLTVAQVKGAAFGEDGSTIGISPTQWYTQQQLKTAIINYYVGLGASQSDAEAVYNQYVEPTVIELFGTYTGTYSGNTLTIDGDTYTKQG
jgi:hypothetical protein